MAKPFLVKYQATETLASVELREGTSYGDTQALNGGYGGDRVGFAVISEISGFQCEVTPCAIQNSGHPSRANEFRAETG